MDNMMKVVELGQRLRVVDVRWGNQYLFSSKAFYAKQPWVTDDGKIPAGERDDMWCAGDGVCIHSGPRTATDERLEVRLGEELRVPSYGVVKLARPGPMNGDSCQIILVAREEGSDFTVNRGGA